MPVRWTWLLVPLPILGVAVFTAGCALLLSALYVRYRDVSSIWTAISRAIFYASPALYPIEFFPENCISCSGSTRWRHCSCKRECGSLIPPRRRSPRRLGGSIYYIPPALVGLGICALGVWYFFRRAPGFAEEL